MFCLGLAVLCGMCCVVPARASTELTITSPPPHPKSCIFIFNPLFNQPFLENICDDEKILQSNLLQKVRNSPDYKDMPEEAALSDLKERIKNYELVYQPVTNDDQSYIKLINLQSKVVCNRIYGTLAQKIVCFLLAVHIGMSYPFLFPLFFFVPLSFSLSFLVFFSLFG